MNLTEGRTEVRIGLIDGPVDVTHPDLSGQRISDVTGCAGAACSTPGEACLHGTFVAGMLVGRRGSAAPALCPGCTLLLRPVFAEGGPRGSDPPNATSQELADAISQCIRGGARILNLSLAFARTSLAAEKALEYALDDAAQQNVLVVAAAGNQGMLGSTAITRHPWVISTVACDLTGRPVGFSNLGKSIGTGGVTVPGDGIVSLAAEGTSMSMSGTSVAAPFVTGTAALLWSEFPHATAGQIRLALVRGAGHRRPAIVPSLLNAWAAYQFLAKAF